MSDQSTPPSDAELTATAVLGVDGVVAMSAGPAGQFRSYLPGGATVPGVRIDGTHVELNVVARYGPALTELGPAVAAALSAVAFASPVRTVAVSVDDLVLPGESLDAERDPADSPVEPAP